MGKALAQLAVLVALFFGVWFGLSRIHWVEVLRIEKATKSTEEKVGDIFWKSIEEDEKVVRSPAAHETMDSLLNHICKANGFAEGTVKLHIVKKDEVNAFAMPNNHMVVYTGLIAACDNEAELCGVLGHEMAHMRNNHVMKKLVKEVGLSVLVSIGSKGSGGAAARQILKLLSGTAYDRSLEKEADLASVDYMVNAKMDPEGLPNFLYRLSNEDTTATSIMNWACTHPDSKERAKYLLDYIKTKDVRKQGFLSTQQWEKLKTDVKED